MKKFTLTLAIMMAIVLLLPLYTIAAEEEYDEDPTTYDTEEWYRGDTGELIDDIDAFILENISSNVNGEQIIPIDPNDLEETGESIDLSITLPMCNTTYAHTIVGYDKDDDKFKITSDWGTVTGYLYWTENEQWYCSNLWQTYTSSKTKTYHTISSGATTFSTNILTDFKPGDSLVVCKKTTAMATFDFNY